MRKKDFSKRIISVAMAAIMSFGAFVSGGVEVSAAGGGKTSEQNGFSHENPMIILEIVPDVAYGEFGYFIEGQEPVALDQMNVGDVDGSMWSFFHTYDGSEAALEAIWDASWNYLGASSNDTFIKAVWGDDAPITSDYIEVITMSPKEINSDYEKTFTEPGYVSVIDKAHLIYVNCGADEENFSGINTGASITYCRVNSEHVIEYMQFSYDNDLSADATMRIYERAKSGSAAFMASAEDMQSITKGDDGITKQTNIEKLCWLFKSFDYEHFSKMYPYVSPRDYASYSDYTADVNAKVTNKESFISVTADDKLRFSGVTAESVGYTMDKRYGWRQTFFMPYKGSATAEPMWEDIGSIHYYLTNNQEASDDFNAFIAYHAALKGITYPKTWIGMYNLANMFCNGPEAIAGMFNQFIGYTVDQSSYLRGKVWLIDGSKPLANSLYGKFGSASWSNSGANVDVVLNAAETYFDPVSADAIEMFEYNNVDGAVIENGATKFPVGNVIEYIIGDFVSEPSVELLSGIKILEIQPVAAYEYTGAAGVDKVVDILGVTDTATIDGMIEVDGITFNEFNGMTRDMISEYDMVIVGSNTAAFGGTPEYTSKASGLLYVKDDYVGSRKFNGNDLTEKAKGNFIELVKSGVPVVLSDGVDDRSVIDSDTNLYAAIGEILGSSYKNVFKLSDLTTSTEKVYYKYNLRSVLNAVEECVVYSLAVDAALTGDGKFKVVLNVAGAKDTNYRVSVGVDTTGNGEYVYYAGSSTDVTIGGSGYADVNVIIEDSALLEKLADTDFYSVKASVSYNGGAVLICYAEKSGSEWNVDNDNSDDDKSSINFETLRTTSYFSNSRAVTDNEIKVLQVRPNDSDGMVDFTTLDHNLGTYNVNVVSVAVGNFNSYIRLSDYELIIVSANLNDEQFGLLSDYIDDEENGDRPVIFTYGSVDSGTISEVPQLLGMKGYSNSAVYNASSAWKSGSQPYAGAVAGSLDFNTNNAAMLNEGQICTYPNNIIATYGNTITIAEADAQVKVLDLEDRKTGEGAELPDVTVWYTLGNGGVSTGDYFTYRGKDAANNYYMYSVGNIHYTMYGQNDVTAAETDLFENLLVLALDRAYPEMVAGSSSLYDLD